MKHTRKEAKLTETKVDSVRRFSKAGPIAAGLGIHKTTLLRWADEGKLTRYKLNSNVVFFDEAEVQALIEGGRV